MEKVKKEGVKTEVLPNSSSISKQLQHLAKLEERMLENMNSLQKIQLQIAEKFDNLAKHLSELLGLFETTAQIFAQDPMHQVTEKDQEFLQKVDQLLDQNKTIAKSLITMEEKLRERAYPLLPNYSMPLKEIPVPGLRQMHQPVAKQNIKEAHEDKEEREPPAPSGPRPLPKF